MIRKKAEEIDEAGSSLYNEANNLRLAPVLVGWLFTDREGAPWAGSLHCKTIRKSTGLIAEESQFTGD
jgi:hypothetical protein